MNELQKEKLTNLVEFFANKANITDKNQIQHLINDMSRLNVDDAIDKILVSLQNLVQRKLLTLDIITNNANLILDLNLKYKSVEDLINRLNWLKAMNMEYPAMPLSENHKLVLEAFDEFNKIIGNKFDAYYTGGMMAYLASGKPLERYHGDLDLFINEEQLLDLKRLIDKNPNFSFVSNMDHKETNGHEYKITYKDGLMSIGLFLFERKKDQSIVVKEYYFENQDKNSNLYVNEKHFTKEYTDMCFSDEIRYHNGIAYKMMSLESIYNSKKNSRPKDRYDASKIEDSIDVIKENEIEKENDNTIKTTKKASVNCVINEIENKTVSLTPELIEIFNNIKNDSNFSSKELAHMYLQLPEYQEFCERYQKQTIQLKEVVKNFRTQNPQLTDEEFFEVFLYDYSKKIIDKIKEDYKGKLTPEIIDRLDKFNIKVINDMEKHGDMTAHSEISQISINNAHFALDEKDIEGKVVRSMGSMPHELFHFVTKMLKDNEHCDEEMVYELDNGEKAFVFGMTGHMINEGMTEKLSSDFCKRNNIYYSLNPSYIQLTKLCEYMMKTNPDINEEFIIHHNYEGVFEKCMPEVVEAYKETERFEYVRNFDLKTKDGKKIKVDPTQVVSSYNQKVEPMQKEEATDKKQEFGYQTNLKENILIERVPNIVESKIKSEELTEKKIQDKQKVKKLVPNRTPQNSTNKNGFTNVLILSIITSGFVVLVALLTSLFIK